MDESEPIRPAARPIAVKEDGAGARDEVEERVLFLLHSNAEAVHASGEVERSGIKTRICADTPELLHALTEGAGVLVLAEETLGKSMGELFRIFDRQRTWSDLPVVVLVRENAPPDMLVTLRAFERHPKIKTTFLQRPVPALSLISAVRSCLQARRRQYQVRDLLAQLNEDVRLRDEFLAMLGHELRNPLSSIGYVAEILDMEGERLTPARAKWGAGVIGRQVRHLSRLLDQLLEVARVQSGKIELNKEPLDLRMLAEQCAESFEASTKTRSLTVALAERPVIVYGDRDRLTQIVDNLLDNAFKYTDENGRIRLSVAADDEAVLTVHDDGKGINSTSLPHVFEPFFQEGRSRSDYRAGLGLGLAMVDNLVRLHGGSIIARSAGTGLGAEFEVRLPRAAVSVPPESAAGRARTLRLLIIEDEVELADIFATLLSSLGHEASVIYEGCSGIEAAARMRPDLVFIDIGLPDIGGGEVARRIRAALGAAAPPLVALTGYPQSDDGDLFDDYLMKPVGRERVERLFRDLVV